MTHRSGQSESSGSLLSVTEVSTSILKEPASPLKTSPDLKTI